MLRNVNRSLLKYSAQRAIFCPLCSAIADCRRWVVLAQAGIVRACCASCFDHATSVKPVPVSVVILDGRVIFKRGK